MIIFADPGAEHSGVERREGARSEIWGTCFLLAGIVPPGYFYLVPHCRSLRGFSFMVLCAIYCWFYCESLHELALWLFLGFVDSFVHRICLPACELEMINGDLIESV